MSSIRILLFFLTISWFFNACVTINVYFPAAAAEKAADQIIDKVWGSESEPHNSESNPSEEISPPPSNESLVPSTSHGLRGHWIDFLISPALASANLDISSPAIQTLQASMAERHKKIESFYHNGAIGLTNDALITLRDPSRVPLKSRRDVKRWLEEENRDRLALYREIAVANRHPEWEADIRATFATRWIERASPGWWYQNDKGQWQQR